MLNLSADLQQAVETMGAGAAGIGFLAGLAFSINPVAVAAIPVSMAYVTKARGKGEALGLGAFFVAGLIATHVALGLIAGLGGRWVSNLMGRSWGLALTATRFCFRRVAEELRRRSHMQRGRSRNRAGLTDWHLVAIDGTQ